MKRCRHGICMEPVGDNGFCERHGGPERLHREWALNAAREAERVKEHKFTPKGQAVPTGGGLSQFGPKTGLSRTEREKRRNARRTALLEAQPRKGSTSEIKDKKKGGNKKSGKQAR